MIIIASSNKIKEIKEYAEILLKKGVGSEILEENGIFELQISEGEYEKISELFNKEYYEKESDYFSKEELNLDKDEYPELELYYRLLFKKFDKEKKYETWNWSAFLFGPFWLFYHKLIKHGIITLIFIILFALYIKFIPALVGGVIIGLYGNYWKYKKYKSRI